MLALTDLSGYETILQFTPYDLNVLIVISLCTGTCRQLQARRGVLWPQFPPTKSERMAFTFINEIWFYSVVKKVLFNCDYTGHWPAGREDLMRMGWILKVHHVIGELLHQQALSICFRSHNSVRMTHMASMPSWWLEIHPSLSEGVTHFTFQHCELIQL